MSKSEKNQSTKTIVESISQNSDVQLGAEALYESHCTDHDEMETDSEGQESVEDIGQNKLLPEKSKEPTSVSVRISISCFLKYKDLCGSGVKGICPEQS